MATKSTTPAQRTGTDTPAPMLTFKLHQTKETKGAVRYDTAPDAPSPLNIYLRKDAITGTAPASITVTVDPA